MRINLVYSDNGAGLPHSARIISDTLDRAGAQLSRREPYIRRPTMGRFAALVRRLLGPRYDINVFLEEVCPWSLTFARRNLLVPNQEWFEPFWTRYLPRFDLVLCKTRDAERRFEELGARVRYVGFTSRDQRRDDVPRLDQALHVAGQSLQKGTAAVLRAWQRHPEWPMLTVLQRRQQPGQELWHPPLPNVTYITERVSDEHVRELQNSHWLHVGPSLAEGFGHWIGEAMSCGAVVVTTDAAPMNELVTPDRGFLVRATPLREQGVATLWQVDDAELENTVARAFALTPQERRKLGDNARSWYDRNDREFRSRFAEAVLAAA